MAVGLSYTETIALGEILDPAKVLSIIQSTNPKLFNLTAFDLISEYIYRSPRLPVFLWSEDINVLIYFPLAPENLKFSKAARYEEIRVPGYHTTIPVYTGADRKRISFTAYFDRSPNSSFADGGSGEIFSYVPGVGCLDVIANFERFIYPMDKPRKPAEAVNFGRVLAAAASNLNSTPLVDFPDPNRTDFYFNDGRTVTTLDGAASIAQKAGVASSKRAAAVGAAMATGRTNVLREYPFYPPPVGYFFAGIRYWKCFVERADITEVRFNKLMIPTHIEVNIELSVLEEDSYYKTSSGEIRSDGFFTQENLQREFYSELGTRASVKDQLASIVVTLTRT